MTQNQIAYFKAVNEARIAEAQLAETARSNRAREALEQSSQKITEGHYLRSDTVNAQTLAENKRSHLVNEELSRIKTAADASLSYATAALRGYEQALTKERTLSEQYGQTLTLEKINTEVGQQYLNEERALSERAGQYLSNAKEEEARANTAYTKKQTTLAPWKTAGELLSGIGKLAGAAAMY